jgi:hypothetical protein
MRLDAQCIHAGKYGDGTVSGHAALAELLDGRFVAVDAAQWLEAFESSQKSKDFVNFQYTNRRQSPAESRRKAAALCIGRLLELLQYGAHPLVVRPSTSEP